MSNRDPFPRHRMYCPICPWTLDEPVEDDDPAATEEAVRAGLEQWARVSGPLAQATETYEQARQNAVLAAVLANKMPAERAVKAHCETHPLEEWVAAAAKLFTIRQSLGILDDAQPPADERVFGAICAGELTVNDGRWIRAAAGIIDAVRAAKEDADA